MKNQKEPNLKNIQMMYKNEKKDDSTTFIDNIKRYIDLKLEYTQLSFTEKVSLLVGRLVLIAFAAILGLALALLLIFLVYVLLMGWIGIDWLVVLIEIGIIGGLMCLLWRFKEKLVIRPVANMIIRILFDSSDNNKKEKDIHESF